MLSVDKVEPGVRERYEVLNGILDRAFVLAAVIEAASEDQAIGDIYVEIGEDLNDLNEDMHLIDGIHLNYTGEGFAALREEEGRFETAFCKILGHAGVLKSVQIIDPSEKSFISKPPDNVEDDDDFSGVMAIRLVDPATETGEDILATPSDRPGLYFEFQTHDDEDDEVEVGGMCVVASGLIVREFLDVLKTKVDLVDDHRLVSEPLIDPDELAIRIDSLSHKIFRLIKTQPFKRMNAKRQKELLEDELFAINNELQLHNYGAYLEPRKAFFVLEGAKDNPGRRLMKATVEDGEEPIEMLVDLLRVDTLDMFNLCSGKKISGSETLLDSKAGLYLVARIKQGIIDGEFGGTDIVWIPISSQKFEGHFFLKQD